MLEIVVLFFLCKSLGAKLRQQGRKPLGYQISLVVSWYVAQVIGGFAYGVYYAMTHDGETPEFNLVLIGISWLCAAVVAGIWFAVVNSMRPLHPDAAMYDYGQKADGAAAHFAPPTDPQNPYAPPRSRN